MYWKFDLDPALLHIGPLEIRWYGLMYVIDMIFGYVVMKYYFIRKKSVNLDVKDLDNLVTYLFVGMLVGARLFYILFYNFEFYSTKPLEIFAFWHGGLSFHGAIFGIAVSMYIFTKRNNYSILDIGDHLAFCGASGLFLGRIGNFINGELWGRVTKVPWAVIFPDGGPLPRHPSQLYESFFEGLVLATILFFTLKIQKYKGTTLFLFCALYSFFRFFIEFYREPDSQLGFITLGLSMGQLLCIAMFIVGCIGLILVRKSEEN
jgi:phosphatidylglycerol:prolipoprotein diacylglycerol transferase